MSLWMKSYGVTIQMKATEQYFSVVLFTTLYKLVLTLNPSINSFFFLAFSFWEGDGLLLDTCAHSDSIIDVFSILSKRTLADFSLILEPHGKCR